MLRLQLLDVTVPSQRVYDVELVLGEAAAGAKHAARQERATRRNQLQIAAPQCPGGRGGGG